IINVLEVLDRILLSLSEHPGADQVKHDVADVFAGMNAPAIEHRHHHRTEFLDRILPHAFEQLRPRHMAHTDALDLLLLLGRKIERVAQKDVAVPLITWVGGDNRIESLGETNLLHQQKCALMRRSWKIIAKAGRATVR